jgi:hypothetical protein
MRPAEPSQGASSLPSRVAAFCTETLVHAAAGGSWAQTWQPAAPLADEALKVELGGSSICVPSHTRSAELTKYAAKLRVLGFASFGVGR